MLALFPGHPVFPYQKLEKSHSQILLKGQERVWCSEWHFLSHGVGQYKNVILALFKSGTQVSDTSLKIITRAPTYKWSRWPPGLLGQPKMCWETICHFGSKYDCLHHANIITVEPLNKELFGSRAFVLFLEVVLWWEVWANMQFIAPSRPTYT